MTRAELLAQLLTQLLTERFGPRRSLERERPPTPGQIRRRQRVLLGDVEENE